jgi:hypothetical protein
MKPANKIIEKFGGVQNMARLLSVPPTTVQYWWEEGVIPTRRQSQVMEGAIANGIIIHPEDFFDLSCFPPGNHNGHRKRPSKGT